MNIIKNIFFVLFLLFSFNAFSAETYICDKLEGWGNIQGNVEETQTFASNTEVILSTEKVIVEVDGEGLSYPCSLLYNSEKRADFVCMADITTELYTINKNVPEMLYVKNGILSEKGYSMMMKAKCRLKK